MADVDVAAPFVAEAGDVLVAPFFVAAGDVEPPFFVEVEAPPFCAPVGDEVILPAAPVGDEVTLPAAPVGDAVLGDFVGLPANRLAALALNDCFVTVDAFPLPLLTRFPFLATEFFSDGGDVIGETIVGAEVVTLDGVAVRVGNAELVGDEVVVGDKVRFGRLPFFFSTRNPFLVVAATTAPPLAPAPFLAAAPFLATAPFLVAPPMVGDVVCDGWDGEGVGVSTTPVDLEIEGALVGDGTAGTDDGAGGDVVGDVNDVGADVLVVGTGATEGVTGIAVGTAVIVGEIDGWGVIPVDVGVTGDAVTGAALLVGEAGAAEVGKVGTTGEEVVGMEVTSATVVLFGAEVGEGRVNDVEFVGAEVGTEGGVVDVEFVGAGVGTEAVAGLGATVVFAGAFVVGAKVAGAADDGDAVTWASDFPTKRIAKMAVAAIIKWRRCMVIINGSG